MEETFSTRSVPRYYNQDQSADAVRELLGFSICEVLEVGSWGQEHFGNTEKEERPPLEAATK
jgi:hypothetical protein